MVSALLTTSFLCGVALIAFGCWLAYHPAGFVAAGVLLVALPVAYVRGGSR